MVVRQHALTVIAELRDGLTPEDAKARLEALQDAVIGAFEHVPSLHFGRFVVIGSPPGETQGFPWRLAMETNHDGDLTRHLGELADALAPFEDEIFGSWKDYEKGRLADFVARHTKDASTFYLGHPGLSVVQIHNDRDLRVRLEALLDAEQDAGRVVGSTAVDLRARLLAGLAGPPPAFQTGPVERGFPAQPSATIYFYLVIVVVVVLLAVVLVPMALFVEPRERALEQVKLVDENDARLERIGEKEDAIGQNGLTHYVALRPGPYRRLVLSAVLWFLEKARQNIAYEGTLGGISSIHFARWVLLGDGSVLFFSNYDGSWEAYLGDFVDKAHVYLSAVWSSTKWFPPTHALIFGGAAKESTFKQWTRTCQVENQIWYSAYPDVTVAEVNRNAALREGASGPMNEAQAQKWLAKL